MTRRPTTCRLATGCLVKKGAPPKIPGLVFVQPLGSGGYADVFLYEQQSPRMPVAVKVLKSEGLTDALRQQFVEEADTMAALGDHPYIVQVFRSGTSDDGRPYLVMKYYPPPNLAMRARAERFSVEDVLRTGIQLASAVETAHRAHITHRDIKPANVLVSAYGAPGLTDFGIAGRGAREGDVEPETTDDVGVSVPWAPPEVLYGQSNGDERSDVYSLAATLWQLLVGRSPFEVPGGDNSAYALMPRIRSTHRPATGRQDVPAGLERLLAQAMAKDPAHRPSSALELARALQAVEQQQRLGRTPIVVLDEQGHTTLVSQTQGSPTGRAIEDDEDRTRIKAPQTVVAQPLGPSPTMPDDETRRRSEAGGQRWSPAPMPEPEPCGRGGAGPPRGGHRPGDQPDASLGLGRRRGGHGPTGDELRRRPKRSLIRLRLDVPAREARGALGPRGRRRRARRSRVFLVAPSRLTPTRRRRGPRRAPPSRCRATTARSATVSSTSRPSRRDVDQGQRLLHVELPAAVDEGHLPRLLRRDAVRRREPRARHGSSRSRPGRYTVKAPKGTKVCATVVVVRSGQASPGADVQCETAQ